jgi:hypothetical protein
MTQPPPHPGGPGEFYRDPEDTEWREVTAEPATPQPPSPDPTEEPDGLPQPDSADQG